MGIEKVLNAPDNFVMKPQIEGSGSVIFGDEMVNILKTRPKNLSEYIIMEKINPPVYPSLVFSGDQKSVVKRDSIGEIGIYSSFVAGEKRNIVQNESFGQLFRTKGVTT